MYGSIIQILLTGVLFCLTVFPINANHFDPHVYPKHGPFFEGWYVRISGLRQNRSFGILFGKVLPDSQEKARDTALASVLIYDPKHSDKLVSYDLFANDTDVNVTVKGGRSVTHDPDFESPADFRWEIKNACYLEVKPNRSRIHFAIGPIIVDVALGSPVPWGRKGVGPEGWLEHFPLPLHWFVFSLRSPVISYTIENKDTHMIYKGENTGVAHMEKNWGNSFPKAWIWSEGVDVKTNISFALSGGPVNFYDIITIPGYLIGYRNPLKGFDLSFRPVDNLIELIHNDGCNGEIAVKAVGIYYSVHFYISAKIGTFSECLYGPETNGFRKACTESYNAKANISVYRLGTLVDTHTIHNSALEFGGDFVCRKRCKQAFT
ncbi:unnamed protein product [Owenia fusiformis]|uniref:Uncharacterized protein n=1 Tax=Owenia fusiformis TaxID=6347 RepID=A0A8J1Y1F7_OWEFU|nr:unnamed protein product [Owenia fusiformis]